MKAYLHTIRFFECCGSYLLTFLILFICGKADATTWYVKPGGTGTGSGSWGNAAPPAQLATIITGAASGDQVWVVGSTSGVTYYPTTGVSRTVSFTMKSGVAVYGGFAGTETALGQQNPTTYITILSGDIGTVGNNTDNSYNVVVSSGNTGTTVLDGFTITNGNANGSGQNSMGGGIYNSGTTITYSNCIITNNTAIGNGGGIYMANAGTITFNNCTISYNTTTVAYGNSSGGGGCYGSGPTTTFSGCMFAHNSTTFADGGGIYIYNNGSFQFTNCVFDTCTAVGNGGGLFDIACQGLTLTGCSFTGNISSGTTTNTTTTYPGGGGIDIRNVGSGFSLTNCSFSLNSSNAYGGGVLTDGTNGFTFTSCYFYRNNAPIYGGGIADEGGSTFTITKCKLSNNAAPSGGGVYVNGGSPTFSIDTLANNSATAGSGMGGGGLCEDVSTNPFISHCWFSGNVTGGANGAGLYDNSSNTDSNTVFQANLAGGGSSDGGGVYHNSSTGKYYNCVFVDNQCTGDGGGLYSFAGNATYEACTFYNNSSGNITTGGDGFYVGNGTNPHVTGDIIWSNNASSVGLVIGSGTPKINYSDIEGVTTTFLSTYGSGNINTAPSFGNSGNYAGTDGMWATADDGLHLTGSAAADAVIPGSFPGDDITDFARPDGSGPNADMGAYEGTGTFAALAVQLLNFTAAPAGNNTVDLNWTTDAAIQAAAYQVQRSANGTDFAPIGTVDAIAGQNSYQFADQNAAGAVIYYRLLIIQADGSQGYSATVIIQHAQPTGQASLRPSVAEQGSTTLYIGSPQAATLNVAIVDASGHILSGRSVTISQGDNYIPLDLSGFPKGAYYVYITGEGGFRKTLPLEKL